MTELEAKLTALRLLLDQYYTDALLLRRVSSFAWATCGAAAYVNTAATEGAAALVITREKCYLATNAIEAPRLRDEERLAEQGWEFVISPWETPQQGLNDLLAGRSLLSDVPFPGAQEVGAVIARLRAHLGPEEVGRFRELGSLCAEAMSAVAQGIRPGMSEYHLAALLGFESQQRGVQPIVNLVATDERAYQYRHPLPTGKELDKYAMLVLCGRRQGLVCSITRLVHFGAVPSDLRQRIAATAQVNATLVAHSRPGRNLGEVFSHGQQAYARLGFAEEWRRHHQGGTAGYEPREQLATPSSTEVIAAGQALAWNPSIAGAKTEDTVLVGMQSNEILTPTPLWPLEKIEIPGQPGEVHCALALEL